MTLDVKKRVVRAVLLLAALWPFGQYALTQIYEVSPWKLFGWAMYTNPQFPVQCKVLEVRGSALVEMERAKLPKEIQDEMLEFEHRRIALGNLARPNRIAEMVFEAYPNLDSFIILAYRKKLDRETALIEMTSRSYPYVREVDAASE